jgi:hypothetical protein
MSSLDDSQRAVGSGIAGKLATAATLLRRADHDAGTLGRAGEFLAQARAQLLQARIALESDTSLLTPMAPSCGDTILPPDGSLFRTAQMPPGKLWFQHDGVARPLREEQRAELGLAETTVLLVDSWPAGVTVGSALPDWEPAAAAAPVVRHAVSEMVQAGSVIRNPDGVHALMQGGRLRPIGDPVSFTMMGLAWGAAVSLSDADWDSLPRGRSFPAVSGSMLRRAADGAIFVLAAGKRIWLPDMDTATVLGFRVSALGGFDFRPFGVASPLDAEFDNVSDDVLNAFPQACFGVG